MPRPTTKTLKCGTCGTRVCDCPRCKGTPLVCDSCDESAPPTHFIGDDWNLCAEETPYQDPRWPVYFVITPSKKDAPHVSWGQMIEVAQQMLEDQGLRGVGGFGSCKEAKCRYGPAVHAHVMTEFWRGPGHPAWQDPAPFTPAV